MLALKTSSNRIHYRRLLNISLIIVLFLQILSAASVANAQSLGSNNPIHPVNSVAAPVQAHADLTTETYGIVGQIGGSVEAIAAEGNYVYIGHGPRMKIFDVSTVGSPQLIGQTELLPGIVYDIIISGVYAYIADGKGGLQVIDITEKSTPKRVGSFFVQDHKMNCKHLVISGNYAYLPDAIAGLYIIDVSIPENPRQVGLFSNFNTGGVDVSGDYAYITVSGFSDSDLIVVNIQDKTSPIQKGHLKITGSAASIGVKGNYAYIVDLENGLRIVNISDPTLPVSAGRYNYSWIFGYNLLIQRDLIYVSTYRDGLFIFDITNPVQPVLKKKYSISGYTKDIALVGNIGFVACDLVGLCIEDLTNPSSPQEISEKMLEITDSINGIALKDSFIHVGNGWIDLAIIDVSNPGNPIEKGLFYPSQNGVFAECTANLAVDGDYTYLAVNTGLRIVKNTNGQIIPIGFLPISTGNGVIYDVAVSGNYAYVPDTLNGLHIIDITDKTNPVEVGSLPLEKNPDAVYVKDNYVFVANLQARFSIIDVTNKTAPKLVGFHDIAWGQITDVIVSGNYAYVAVQNYGLLIFDISNKTSPVLVSVVDNFKLPYGSTGLDLHNQFIYSVDGIGGLWLIDVSNPAHPRIQNHYDTAGAARHVVTDGNYTYVDDGIGGLVVIKASTITYRTALPVILNGG